MGFWQPLFASCGNVRWGVGLGDHKVPVRSWFRPKLLNVPEEAEGWLRDIPPSVYQRWWKVFSSLPPALTIVTDHGLTSVVHAEAPAVEWDRAAELLAIGVEEAYGMALLGHEEKADGDARARPGQGFRALVHAHCPVKLAAPTLTAGTSAPGRVSGGGSG